MQLLPLWPCEREDRSTAECEKNVAALCRALREERRRGAQGQLAYDLRRHAALAQALKSERAKLAAVQAARRENRSCDR